WDREVLRTGFGTRSALPAQPGMGPVTDQAAMSSDILELRRPVTGEECIGVIACETTGYIDPGRAWHAIAAARAPDLHQPPVFIPHPSDKCVFIAGKGIWKGTVCNPQVLIDVGFIVHAREDNGHFRVVPDPAEAPFS